jgi:hypothetical protein
LESPATTLSASSYPHFRYYLLTNKTKDRLTRIALTGWDIDAQVVNATITAGMSPLPSNGGHCRTFSSWYEYIRFFAIEEYYGADKAQAVTPANFTLRYQLSVDFLGWPDSQPVPLTPYAKFDAAQSRPSKGGSHPFRAQGVFSHAPWSNLATTAVYNLLDVGVVSGGYVLGGALAGPAGPAAIDGVGSAAGSAWQHATTIFMTDVSASNAAGITAADATGQVMDTDTAPPGVGKRFYNFLNCYGQSPGGDGSLFDLYYGDMATRLVAIKRKAHATGRMTTWCGW